MDTVPDGVILLDANRRIVLANPAALQYLPVLVDEIPAPNTPLVRLADQPIENLLTIAPDRPWHEIQIGPVISRGRIRVLWCAKRPERACF